MLAEMLVALSSLLVAADAQPRKSEEVRAADAAKPCDRHSLAAQLRLLIAGEPAEITRKRAPVIEIDVLVHWASPQRPLQSACVIVGPM